MPGLIMSVLRQRLQQEHGFRGHEFSYQSVVGDLDANIQRLREFVEAIPGERAHIVAHSLGGVTALQMLRRYPDLPIDRVVCLGSPLVDSQPARLLQQFEWGRAIVGRTLIEGVLENPLGEWSGSQEVGVIAGTMPFGSAKLIMPLAKPNDGVVAAVETRLPGITDHLELPVTHSGLVFSEVVAHHTAAFLRAGRFD